MDKKALFLDLDGTLLNDQKEITSENRTAVEKALAAGHKIIIDTGRPLVSAIQQAEALNLVDEGCYLIAYNGGILYDIGHQKIIFQGSIPLDLVILIFEEANRRHLHIQTYNDTEVLVEPHCDDNEIKHYCKSINMTYQVIPNIHELEQAPVKILLANLRDPNPLKEFRKWIGTWADTLLDTYFSSNVYLEIVPKGINKGAAMCQMVELLRIPLENTVAVGDSENDIFMIRAAHIGVSMCNGIAECKAAADYITSRDNNHNGIVEVIEKFIL